MMMKEWHRTFVAVDVGIAVDNGPMVVDDGVERSIAAYIGEALLETAVHNSIIRRRRQSQEKSQGKW